MSTETNWPGLSEEQVERLAIEHEDFGMGQVDNHGYTTHGFGADGLRNFVKALREGDRAAHEAQRGSEVEKVIHHWPYCETCEKPYSFDPDEPFAYCACGCSEWGYPRPASYIPDPSAQRGKGEPAAAIPSAELQRLASIFPEQNLSNYGPDDVEELNAWGIEVVTEIDRLTNAIPALRPALRAKGDKKTYLCKAWGETDYPSVAIVQSLEAVRQFFIDQWLGSADHKQDDGTDSLEGAMLDMTDHWGVEGDRAKWSIEFEIGGVSVERVDDVGEVLYGAPSIGAVTPAMMKAWTPEEKAKLQATLAEVFGWSILQSEEKTNE